MKLTENNQKMKEKQEVTKKKLKKYNETST